MSHGDRMFLAVGFMAALLVAAVLTPGCRTVGAVPEPDLPDPDAAARESVDEHDHAGHVTSARVPDSRHAHHAALEAGGPEMLIHYRAGQGFVPIRLDVDTGTRVVLVDESGGQLAPRFGAGGQQAVESGDSDTPSEHAERSARPDHGAAHAGSASDHGDLGEHGGHDHGGSPVWIADGSGDTGAARRFVHTFETSGYWRFHNAAAPGHAALVVALTSPGESRNPWPPPAYRTPAST